MCLLVINFVSILLTGSFLVFWHNDLGPALYCWGFLGLTYFKNPNLQTSTYIEYVSKSSKSNKLTNHFTDWKEIFSLRWNLFDPVIQAFTWTKNIPIVSASPTQITVTE